MKYAIIISILIWTLAIKAFADYRLPMPIVKVNMTAVEGANSMDVATQKRAFNEALRDMRGEGFRVVKGKVEVRKDPFPIYRSSEDLGVIFQEFSSWYFLANALGLRKEMQVRHILAPPIEIGGSLYFGGLALECSVKKGGFSYSNAISFNVKGEARYKHTVNDIKHEIGHALGARHDQSNANTMHENASAELNQVIISGVGRRLFFNKKAKNEILECLR